MQGISLGFAGLVVALLLLLIRTPIGVALGAPAIVGIWLFAGSNAAWGMFAQVPFEFSTSWTLSSVPMFLLMGYVSYHARITEGLFRAAQLWLGRLPGGLGVASVAGGAAFSAVTGSSLAAAAAMGRIAAPEMTRLGYRPGFAAGTLAAAGTIGSLIPPSIIMIVYGIFAEVSISQLFIAGIIPGLLTACLYSAVIIIRVLVNPDIAPRSDEHFPWRERFRSILDSWPFALLLFGVFGGLFAGVFTPTEAGAVGALLSLMIAAFKGALTSRVVREAVVDTLQSTASIFFIAIGAALLTRFLSFTGVPVFLSEMVVQAGLGSIGLMFAIAGLYLLLGMFLDPLGCMLLTLPILLPIMELQNANLVWFGILVVKFLEIGLITPPVGLNVYIISGVMGNSVPVTAIFRGVAWFIFADLLLVAAIIYFPQIALFLPGFAD